MKRGKILWVTDPWDTLDHPTETTLRLIEESLTLGIETDWCDVKTIRMLNGKVELKASKVREVAPGRSKDAFQMDPSRVATPGEFRRVVYRVDPPVDHAFLYPLQLLEQGLVRKPRQKRRTELINSPGVLFGSSEKLEGARIHELFPPSVVSSDQEQLSSFAALHPLSVLKPLHTAQSRGVELLDWRSPDGQQRALKTMQEATDGFRQPILLQRFLEGIRQGELRLWFLDGRLLAAARKVPAPGEFKVRIGQAGTAESRVEPATLNRKERAAARKIGLHLKKRRVRMAAIDLIDGWITDFNFTSPGLLVELERVTGQNLAKPIILSLLKPLR